MPNFDSGRANSIGGLNIRQRRSSDLGAIRFDANITTTPTSANDMLLYRRSNGLRFWDGSSEYNLLTSVAGSVGDLNGVYENGRTITVDEGAVIWNDATSGAANLMEFNKTGAGSGNILDFDFTAAFTGNVLNLDMGSGIAAVGIVIDSEGGARTGTDLLFTDDSTGTHSNIVINKSGAGASTGFEYVNSYNGSPGGNAISLTFDNSDGLSTGGILITRGTGVRTDNAIAIADASTGNVDVIDINITGAYTGDIFSIVTSAAATGNALFVNLDSAVAATALHIEGSGVRTQPYVELSSDSTGSAVYMDINIDGAGSGNVIDIVTSTTFTGSLINLDLSVATGGVALTFVGGNAARTANLVNVTNDGSGNTDFVEVTDSNTGTGHLFDINTSGIGSGDVINITYSAADTGDAVAVVMADNVAGGALTITGAGARTDSLIDVVSAETGSMDGMVLLQTTGVFTGHMLTVHSDAAATTGGLVHLDLDAGVAYKALTIDHAGARTVETILVTFDGTFGSGAGGTFLNLDVTMTGASASPLFDIDVTGVYTGNIFDVVFGNASASTGHALHVDMGTNLAGNAILIDAAGTRTAPLIYIANTGADGGTDDHVLFIYQTGLLNSNLINLEFATAASDGEAINIVMGTNVAGSALQINGTGTRTDDLIKIDDDSTGNSHIFDINLTGIYTGNVLDISFATAAATGHALHVDMGTNLAGNALLIDAAGTRTAPLIYIANTGADGGTDDHVLFVYQTGVLNSNVINIEYATGASDGNALMIAMGTNVAGSAIQMTTAGTGTSGEGCGIDITHTGDLGAGANLVDIISTGSPSSTSYVMSLQQTTGAGSAGAYVLYLNATGANVEALKVDAGGVVFDESLTIGTTLGVTGAVTLSNTLAVTGAATLSSTLSYRQLTEVVTSTNVITAAESGTTFYLNSATEFASTLPAPAAGLHFKFVVTAAPSGANYTIVSASGTDIIQGSAEVNGASVPAVNEDSINLVSAAAAVGDWVEVNSDGTNWYVSGMGVAAGSITFTVT